MEKDWKEVLKVVKMDKPISKPRSQKVKGPTFRRLKELTKDWRQMHPQNLVIRINPLFNTISHKYTGGWPDETSPEVSPQFLLENLGDLIKMVYINKGALYLRTNRGFFKFYNKDVLQERD